MKTDFYHPAAIILLLLAASCNSGNEYRQAAPPPRRDSIDITEVNVVLPEAKGKELVEVSCMPCHSLRYIEMQPAMTKQSWEKIVAKMIKSYGAPVRDSASAASIVQYLAAVRGKR